jgi:plastocyanin domain-containing protein
VHGLGAKIFFKTAGLLVVAFAIFNLSNGYNLTGWKPFWETSGTALPVEASVPVENGVQIARMKQSAVGFEPRAFVVKKGVPVRWIVNATEPNSCSNGISVPSLSIVQYFTPGQNIIEFTPTEVGTIRFTCPMGMFPGSFTVID